MKRKHIRINALIIAAAITATTSFSTVAAFADETDDYENDWNQDDDWDTATTIDYSQIEPAQTSYTIKQDTDGASLTVDFTGIPYGEYLSYDDLGSVTSSNPDMDISDSDLSNNQFTCTIYGTGTTVISFTIGTKQLSVTVIVEPKYDFSKVKLKKKSVTICGQTTYNDTTVALSGMPEMDEDDSDYVEISDVNSSNPDMSVSISYESYDGKLHLDVDGTGQTDVTFSLSGTPLELKVTLIQAWIKTSEYLLPKGQSKTIKIRGNLYGLKPVYKSLSPSVASVSSSGKVKAKKAGYAVIKVKLGSGSDSDSIGTMVNVASKKKINAFKWAKRYAAKNTYSQPKRMSKGYFDCSSLVWRAYHSQGINLLYKSYAPTAADLGKYLTGKGKKVKNEQKLQVGDLLFKTGANNGRYKGVYHVEMFGGYDLYGFDEDGKPELYETYARLGGPSRDADFYCRP